MAITARYAGVCTATGREYEAGTQIEKGPRGWQIVGAVVDAAPARRSGFHGELWQECERRGCDTEPVCAGCFYCDRHCTCPPPPTADEIAAEKAARAAKAARIRGARAALLARLDAGEDPCSIPIQRQGHTGMFGTDWPTITDPEHVGHFLDLVLAREPWRAPRDKREPMTTREELVRYLLTSGKEMRWDDEWNANIRIHPEVPDPEVEEAEAFTQELLG
jgi:hypothetical protein